MNIVLFATTRTKLDKEGSKAKGFPFYLDEFDGSNDFINELSEKFKRQGMDSQDCILLSPNFENHDSVLIPLPSEAKLVTEDGVNEEYWKFWQNLDSYEAEKLLAYLQQLGESRVNEDIEVVYEHMGDAHFGVFDTHEDFAEEYLEVYRFDDKEKMDEFLKGGVDLKQVADDAVKKEGFSFVDNGVNLHYFKR